MADSPMIPVGKKKKKYYKKNGIVISFTPSLWYATNARTARTERPSGADDTTPGDLSLPYPHTTRLNLDPRMVPSLGLSSEFLGIFSHLQSRPSTVCNAALHLRSIARPTFAPQLRRRRTDGRIIRDWRARERNRQSFPPSCACRLDSLLVPFQSSTTDPAKVFRNNDVYIRIYRMIQKTCFDFYGS